MKILIFALVLTLTPFSFVVAQTDYYLEIDGVEGESTDTSSSDQQELDARQAETTTEKKGNVETTWKVEEGESTASSGVEPDEIDNSATGETSGGVNVGVGDVNNDTEASASGYLKIGDIKGESQESAGIEPDEIDFMGEQETNFALLLSSGDDGGSDEDEEGEESQRNQIEAILMQGLQEDEVPTEEVAFYYNKISTKHRQEVKLFGFIPVQTTATVDIDAEGEVKVKFPWWAFLAGGKDTSIGANVKASLSATIAAHQDTMMSIIRNMK